MTSQAQYLSTPYHWTISPAKEEPNQVFMMDANVSTTQTVLLDTPDLTVYIVLIFVVLLPLSLFVIVGNILVIIAVYTSFHLRERAFYYVVGSMAATDMLVGFLYIPVYYMAIFVDSYKESLYGCLASISILLVPSMTSILHVLVIAADRYIAICFSLEYPMIVTRRKIFTTIALIWVYALSFNALPYLGWRRKHPHVPLAYCFTDQVWTPSLVCLQFGLTLIVPLIIMTCIYERICRIAHLQARRVDPLVKFVKTSDYNNASGQSSLGSSDDRGASPRAPQQPVVRVQPPMSELKAVKTSAIVLGTFIVCWVPAYAVHITFTVINSGRDEPIHTPIVAILQASSNVLPFFSSAANPVIYAFRSEDFRKSFRRSLRISS
nr:5-hydroxytryptamine receptor 1A-like [Lytechinus pictus]